MPFSEQSSRKSPRGGMRQSDLDVARLHAGKKLRKPEVLKLFGYSPSTNLFDTAIMQCGIIVHLKRNLYLVRNPLNVKLVKEE
jgi:hypothetical protein